MLFVTSVLIVVTKVKNDPIIVSGDSHPENNDGIGLDYDYMWNVTTYLSNATHKYNTSTIPKGRAFGSWGCEKYSQDYIYHLMKDIDKLNLSDVKLEKLKPITHIPFLTTHYASMMDVTGYRLTIERDNYTLPRNVPRSEYFPAACGVADKETGEMTHNYSMRESDDVRVALHLDNTSWPRNETLTGDYKNVTCEQVNNADFICGEVALIDNTSDLPDDQTAYLFLVNETNDCEKILDNITDASAVVLLDSGERGNDTLNASKYFFPIKKVNASNENLTNIIERLRNNENIFADNLNNYSTITFSYNLFNRYWPPFNFTVIYEINTTTETFINLSWTKLYFDTIFIYSQNHNHDTRCYELICYSNKNDGTHYMAMTNEKWNKIYTQFPYLPVYYVNNSVGRFLDQWLGCSNNTVSGFINQTYYPGTNSTNGIDAYDIVGHINIPKSPNNSIVVISGRPDSWWGECPEDSGAGAGIVLGIAKYFKDNQITSKYNLTFLEDTGEEYGFRGAQYYSDNHSDENIILFIGADQLGMKQNGTHLNFLFKNATTQDIVHAIVGETHYNERTIYGPVTYATDDLHGIFDNFYKAINFFDATDGSVWKRRDLPSGSNSPYPCDTIVMNKENWPSHHQTGLNFTEGDSLKNTNRSDLNISFELFWNITKYFCVNPNSWFNDVEFTAFDSLNDGDTLPDSIRANFSISSILPNDNVRVDAVLIDQNDEEVASSYGEYTISNQWVDIKSITLTLPPTIVQGVYKYQIRLYNSTGWTNKRVNSYDDVPNETCNSSYVHLYHPFGNPTIGLLRINTANVISGSYFTTNEYGTARNITAYIQANATGPSIHSMCMIYRKNDSRLIGRTQEINVATGETPRWVVYNFTTSDTKLEKNTEYVLTCWSNNPCYLYYDYNVERLWGRHENLTYGAPPDPAEWNISDHNLYSIYCSYENDSTPPSITNVTAIPHIIGLGGNMTISTDVVDYFSGVNTVEVHINPPGEFSITNNNTMTLINNNTYCFTFNSTWVTGQYNYTIWATDNSNNTASSSGHHFHVSADATISIATMKDSYKDDEYINITDPPNPLENLTVVGRGLTWNTYYNASLGENILESYQGPVNYQDDNNTWTPINNSLQELTSNHPVYPYGYRIGNNRGLFGVYFKPNLQSDWPVAFTYNRTDDTTTNAVRSKLIGVGYIDPASNWAYHYLQSVQNSQGQINGYSIIYPDVFTGADVTWSYGTTGVKEAITISNATKTVLQNHLPSSYGLHDASSYLVFITKLDHQSLNIYNVSGILTGNATIFHMGVEFKDALGRFTCALPLGDAYELNNESSRQALTYRIIHINDTTYLFTGVKLSDLNTMMFPVVIDPTISINSLPNDGYISNSNTNYNTAWNASIGTVDSFASYLSIGQKKAGYPIATYSVYRGFVLFNTSALPSNAFLDNAILSLYTSNDYSATDFLLTIQNGQPTYPHNPLQAQDYAKSHYSGNGGSANTANFVNRCNNITLTNLSWINTEGITKLCLRSSRDINGTVPSGNEYINIYSANTPTAEYIPKLIITYRNQSKFKSTGSTNISGYLLIQVQFYNTSQGNWDVDNDAVNETLPRTVTSGNQLALDTIFNGHVKASNLTHDEGTYRVYTAFRDPDGNILKTDDGKKLEAWWQFDKT
jgi:hypothetical protein